MTKNLDSKKWTEREMQLALATTWHHFTRGMVVPNVAHGMFGMREMDLVVMSDKGYVTEVEIKVSKADVKKDLDKRHRHIDWTNRIKQVYFALPSELVRPDVLELIPEDFGVISVRRENFWYAWNYERRAKINRDARPLNSRERFRLARLGALRFWSREQKWGIEEYDDVQ